MRAIYTVAALAVVGLLGSAAYSYRVESQTQTKANAPEMAVVVETPLRDVGEQPLGKTQLVFRITNPSKQSAEVVSLPEACGYGCCLKPLTPTPQSIPPGGLVDVACEFLVVCPGPFEFSGDMYLNDNGLRTVKLTVRGTGVAPKVDDAPPKP